MHRFLKYYSAVTIFCIAAISYIAFVYNRTNHTSLGLDGYFYVLLLNVVFCFIYREPGKWKRVLLIVSLTGLVELSVLYLFNILLEYDTWIDKDMPGKYTW